MTETHGNGAYPGSQLCVSSDTYYFSRSKIDISRQSWHMKIAKIAAADVSAKRNSITKVAICADQQICNGELESRCDDI